MSEKQGPWKSYGQRQLERGNFSPNIEDLRDGANRPTSRFMQSNPTGDFTFYPKMATKPGEKAVLPYRDPEAFFNSLGSEFHERFYRQTDDAKLRAKTFPWTRFRKD